MSMHSNKGIASVSMSFLLAWETTWECDCKPRGRSLFNSRRNCRNHLPKWPDHLPPPAPRPVLVCHTPSLAKCLFRFLLIFSLGCFLIVEPEGFLTYSKHRSFIDIRFANIYRHLWFVFSPDSQSLFFFQQ